MSFRKMVNTTRAWEALTQILPGGVSSPVRAGKAVNVLPPVIEKGEGAWIEDVDGNRYIDMCMSWGALLHGHAHPAVVAAATEATRRGSTFGTATVMEGTLALAIQNAMPSMELVRFVSTGTESTMSSVRCARAATGRPLVVKFKGHYHGHSDQFLVKAGSGVASLPESSSLGVPSAFVQHTLCLPFNDVHAVRETFDTCGSQIAAVIVEPIAANMGVVSSDPQFLNCLREVTKATQSLLIFDEVVTGFRVGYGGAQAYYGITPDLTCLGKIIGGGFPAAAFGGRKEIMSLLAPQGGVYQAGTLSGNPVAMSAGCATLALCQEKGMYQTLEEKTERLFRPVQEYIATHNVNACVQRHGSMGTLFFGARQVRGQGEELLDHERYKRFFQYMLSRGVFLPMAQNEAWFVSSSHKNDEIGYVSSMIIEFFSQDHP
jgi:glutamate-1-semialdehyde 2,1-aminomutase